MITQVRAARPGIILDGKDYYSALAPYLISMSYTDNCDGKKADDLEIVLADRDMKFINEWMPKKGAFLDASIIAERWFAPYSARLTLDCGRFWIDSVEFKLPDQTVTIKATSIPTGVRIKSSVETRGWEDTTMRDIAQQIADDSHMQLDWRAKSNPRYGRTEMHDESPLAYLQKKAKDAKLAIKVHRNTLVIFDEQELEEAGAQFSLIYGNKASGPLGNLLGGLGTSFASVTGPSYRMAGATFHTSLTDTTKKSKVSYIDPDTGEVKSGEHTAEDEEGETDEGDAENETADQVNQDPDTDDEEHEEGDSIGDPSRALREGELPPVPSGLESKSGDLGPSLAAKARNRDKNKDKNNAQIVMAIGNPLVAAGQTLNLVGVGQFDGKWFVVSADHKVGPQYDTELTIRRCLKGY